MSKRLNRKYLRKMILREMRLLKEEITDPYERIDAFIDYMRDKGVEMKGRNEPDEPLYVIIPNAGRFLIKEA